MIPIDRWRMSNFSQRGGFQAPHGAIRGELFDATATFPSFVRLCVENLFRWLGSRGIPKGAGPGVA